MIPRYRNLSPFSCWALHVVMSNCLTQTVRVEHRYSQENTLWGKAYLLLSAVFFLGCVWEKAESNWHFLWKKQTSFRLVEIGRVDLEKIQRIILNYFSDSCHHIATKSHLLWPPNSYHEGRVRFHSAETIPICSHCYFDWSVWCKSSSTLGTEMLCRPVVLGSLAYDHPFEVSGWSHHTPSSSLKLRTGSSS